MSWRARLTLAAAIALGCFVPVTARAQAADESKISIVIGGTSTTLRGDCQDCEGEGGYLQTGGFLAGVGYRLTSRMDAGVELFWVPVTTEAGNHVRSTFVLGAAQFRPWASRGFFLKTGIGMGFVRNWIYDVSGARPPITSKALGLSYGAGWTFRHTERVGLQVFGAQHVAALGDFETGASKVENVIGNFWSVGAAIIIR